MFAALDTTRSGDATQFANLLVSDLPDVTGTFGDGGVTFADSLGPGAGRVVTDDGGDHFPHVVINANLFGRSTTIPGTDPHLDPSRETLHDVLDMSDVDLANFFGLGSFEAGEGAQAGQAVALWFDPKKRNSGAASEN